MVNARDAGYAENMIVRTMQAQRWAF